MFKGLIFVFTILALVVQAGVSLGELSIAVAVMILLIWLCLLGVTVALGWSSAVVIVGTVILGIVCILTVFGGDIRIR